MEAEIPDRAKLGEYLLQYQSITFRTLVYEDAMRYKRLKNALFATGFWAVFIYRLSHLCYRRGFNPVGMLLQFFNQMVFRCEISRKAIIGPALAIFHCNDIFIAPYVILGSKTTVGSGVFIASNNKPFDPADYPWIDDGVSFYAGAKVLGPIVIGKYSSIAPNAVVMKNIPSFSTVMPPNCMIIQRDKWKNLKGIGQPPNLDEQPPG